ncbi:MAG: hypothetical protein Q9182_003689 [Xanthomendoza sp. 2 TL-2023]
MKDHFPPDHLKQGPLLSNLYLLASPSCNGLASHLRAQNLSLDLWLVYYPTVGTDSLTFKGLSDPGVRATGMKCVKGTGPPLHQARLPTSLLTVVFVKLRVSISMGVVACQGLPLRAHLQALGTKGEGGVTTAAGTTVVADTTVLAHHSSIASISSSDFSGVDLGQIRDSLAILRADPDRKVRLSATVRQFKSELRQSRRQHRDSARGKRNETKGLKGELKAQHKEMKAELKSFIKDARAAHKADRKVRKAERKAGRAKRRAERRGTDAHAKGEKKVAKAEARALKAQRRVLEVDAIARARAMQADGLSNGGREDGLLPYPAGEKVFEEERRDGEQEIAVRTRSMDLTDTKGQESGICVKEG